MKEKKEMISSVLTLLLLLTFAVAPHGRLRPVNAQDRTINVNEKLDFRALGIDNEARQLVSLIDVQLKFFKRGAELREKSILSPRDPESFREEADKRKADLTTIKSQLQSFISKLKQKNRWDEAFDAQFLVSLAKDSDRSALTQAGGARKVFQTALDEVLLVRAEIDDEVDHIKSRQTVSLRYRSNRVLAAHATFLMGKVGCSYLFLTYLVASVGGQGTHAFACAVADRYNTKGCTPPISCD